MKLWLYTLIIILFLAILAWFNSNLDIPVVYWSYSKNKCVKVVKKWIDCPCDKLNYKYERILVK